MEFAIHRKGKKRGKESERLRHDDNNELIMNEWSYDEHTNWLRIKVY